MDNFFSSSKLSVDALESPAPMLSPSGTKILTVSELNRRIKGSLEGQFSALWVEGEVSNFKHHSSGHMYFSIKDDRSQVGVVFFSRYNTRLKFELREGLKILIRGRISVYEPRGQYQIYAEEVLPKGLGELQLALEQLRAKLEAEGLFDASRKKPIPSFPWTVGIVTSPTGAAIQDILNVMTRRFRGVRIILAPVQVQGDGAAKEIAQAIQDMNNFAQAEVLIVGRGGGSMEDLWAFNEEAVVRAIASSRIPVISAVGHEVDWTLSDAAADLRAPTPSAAAELVVQNRDEVEMTLQDARSRLNRGLQLTLESARERLQGLTSRYAFRHPRMLLENAAQQLDETARQLGLQLKNRTEQNRMLLENQIGRLEALSPLAILKRGYSLATTPAGDLIKSKTQIKIGQILRTQFQDGTVTSVVQSLGQKEESASWPKK